MWLNGLCFNEVACGCLHFPDDVAEAQKGQPLIQAAAMGVSGSGVVLPATMGRRRLSVAGPGSRASPLVLLPSSRCLPSFLDQHATPGSARNPGFLLGMRVACRETPSSLLDVIWAGTVWCHPGVGLEASEHPPPHPTAPCISDIPETNPHGQGIWGEVGLPGTERASCLQLKL